MSEILEISQDRHSSRVTFDPEHQPSKQDLIQILEAARWAPTAHNMQNIEIIVVDNKRYLKKLGNIKSKISEEFLRENYQQLSFSEEELLQKKVGILGTMFPQPWRTPDDWGKVACESEPSSLDQTILIATQTNFTAVIKGQSNNERSDLSPAHKNSMIIGTGCIHKLRFKYPLAQFAIQLANYLRFRVYISRLIE